MEIIQDSMYNYFIWGGLLLPGVGNYLKHEKKPVIIKKSNADYSKYVIGINTRELGTFNLSEPQLYDFYTLDRSKNIEPCEIYYAVTFLD